RQVSADIAHDLKTPLNRLKLIVEAAIDKQEKGIPVDADLVEARAESDQINATFDALLRIAQIESGARRSRFVTQDLGGIMSAITEAFGEVAADEGLKLEYRNDAAGAWIVGDRELLLQLFANLVENSLRHCPKGTAIHIWLEEAGGNVVAGVRDNGPGIPESERENVLRRLYRLDKSRTTPGTGLGLSLVKAIADLHGAVLRLDDAGPGLSISLAFPAASAHGADAAYAKNEKQFQRDKAAS
ncbi:sensor histidine kinase, partial [Rhizobiaceae sp. 2RAB30]